MLLFTLFSGILFMVFICFTIFLLLYYHFSLIPIHIKCSKLPSIPSQYFIFGIALNRFIYKFNTEDILYYLDSVWKTVGNIFYFHVLGRVAVMLFKPEHIEILLTSKKFITKGTEYQSFLPWLGEGLLISTGDKWQTRRKQLTPSFHFQILKNYIPTFNKNARLLLEELIEIASEVDRPVQISSIISKHSLNVICETTMGICLNDKSKVGSEYISNIKRCSEINFRYQTKFWYRNQLIFRLSQDGRDYLKLVKKINEFVEKIVDERKYKHILEEKRCNDIDNITSNFNIYKQKKSFLDHLLCIQKENSEILTDKDIVDEVNTFLFEGHDTTSSAITFTLFMLALHNNVQEKVRQEVIDVLGIDDDAQICIDDLHKLNYMEMVVKETLRLYPSVSFLSRKISEELKLDDNKYCIPAGANVIFIPYLLHRNPEFFPNPETFDPERFSPDRWKNIHPFAYLPFSGGYRNCIGQKFAMMEVKIMLSTVLRKLRVTTPLKMDEMKVIPTVILKSVPPITLKFQSTHLR